jgi:nicotinate-nucleotide pyrophosphorylase (carboxylating)
MNVYEHRDTVELIRLALREDLGDIGDLTCAALVPAGARLQVTVTAKEAGVLCGMPLFAQVFAALGGDVTLSEVAEDGRSVQPGDVVLRGQGNAAVLLQGERTALNLAQRLSGTATLAQIYAKTVAGTRAHVFDTRKTTPGMRLLQKHAVAVGGGANHRIGLYDQVLIKENHIALMNAEANASPAEAVRQCREKLGTNAIIEVEIEALDALVGVIQAGADIVLCDNMDADVLREAVRIRDATTSPRPQVDLEASGGITLKNLRSIAESGVERISIGALTHSASCLDLSMRCRPL